MFKLGFPPTPKTVSFVIPSKGQYCQGETFPLKIDITGIKTPVNAVQADLGFDPAKLEVLGISIEESFAEVFIQEEINNEAGYARLTGGLPHPGFISDRGIFGTVLFRGKEPGVASIEFLPSSLVLANDGRGTNVLKDFFSVSYLIIPEEEGCKKKEQGKEIAFYPEVLGEGTQRTQIKFYEEEKVLGAQVGDREEEKTEEKTDLKELFFDRLETVDHTILSLWGRLVSR